MAQRGVYNCENDTVRLNGVNQENILVNHRIVCDVSQILADLGCQSIVFAHLNHIVVHV